MKDTELSIKNEWEAGEFKKKNDTIQLIISSNLETRFIKWSILVEGHYITLQKSDHIKYP